MASLSEILQFIKGGRNSFIVNPSTTFQSVVNTNILSQTLGDTGWTDLHNVLGAGGQHFQDIVFTVNTAATVTAGAFTVEMTNDLTAAAVTMDVINTTAATANLALPITPGSNFTASYRAMNPLGFRYARVRISTTFTGATTGIRLLQLQYVPKAILPPILRVWLQNLVNVGTVNTVTSVSSSAAALATTNVDIPSGSQITNTNSGNFTVPSGSTHIFEVNVTNIVGGTNPTMITTIQASTNGGTTFFDLHPIRANAIGVWRSPPLTMPGTIYRINTVVTGTPTNFTRTVTRVSSQATTLGHSQIGGRIPVSFNYYSGTNLTGLLMITPTDITQGDNTLPGGVYTVPAGMRLVICAASFAEFTDPFLGANTSVYDAGQFQLRISPPGVAIGTTSPVVATLPYSLLYINPTPTSAAGRYTTGQHTWAPGVIEIPSGYTVQLSGRVSNGTAIRVGGAIQGYLING
jgi:hypothetical protein